MKLNRLVISLGTVVTLMFATACDDKKGDDKAASNSKSEDKSDKDKVKKEEAKEEAKADEKKAADPAPAGGTVKTWADAKLQVELPAGWKVEEQGPMVVAADPTDEAALMFFVVDAAQLDAAVASVDAEVKKLAPDVKWEPAVKDQVNGLPAIALKGSATFEGKPAHTFAVIVASVPTSKALVSLYMVSQEKKDAHMPVVKKAFESIKATS